MSGYCNDCGNTLCLCDDIAADNERIKKELSKPRSETQKIMDCLNEIHAVIEKHDLDSDNWHFVYRALKQIHGGESEESHVDWIAQKAAMRALELAGIKK